MTGRPRAEADRIKAAVGQIFGAVAPDYDQSGVEFFRLFARHLVDRLDPQPGWHVVDVGSGRGAVVFPLLGAIGADGRVTAVDLAEPMVRALQADLAAHGITTVDARVGDIDTLDLGEVSADAVTASMVLFFVPEPGRALRAVHRVLRPGGRLAFSVFGGSDPRWRPVYDAFLPFLPGAGSDDDLSRPRHPDLSSVEQLRAVVESAGFEDVQIGEEVHEVHFASLDQWHAWSWSIGLRGTWLQIPENVRPTAVDAVLAAVEATRRADGRLTEEFSVHYVLAHRPVDG